MKSRKATSKNDQNGSASKKNGQENQTLLEMATATLIQTQALFNQQFAQTNQQIAQTNQQMDQFRAESRQIERENAERFARIEQLLLRHERMLEGLPEAVRQKIGFQKK